MNPSPYDDGWLLDNLAVEMQLNHPKTTSIFSTANASTMEECGGCGAKLVEEHTDEQGRSVRDFACGHRYLIGQRTVSIERV